MAEPSVVLPGQGRLRAALPVVGPPVAAAVLGNALIGKGSMTWFRGLRAPRMQVPLAAFGAVGAAYYAQLGFVLYRAQRNDDRRVRRLAMMVLAGNELWNLAFFGRRSTRNGFVGIVVFLGPLLALQKAVASDRASATALTPYTLWVVGYDVPWTYRLWRLNPGTSRGVTAA
jgi:tryptophan-rich sensory protein